MCQALTIYKAIRTVTEVDYTLAELLLGGLVVFVAYLVRGITGFGSGLISIPLLTLMFPLKVVVPIVVLLDLIGSGSQAVTNRKHTDWKILYPLIPMTLIGIAWAIYFFRYADTQTLSFALGVFVVLFAVYQLLPAPALQGGPLMALPFGLLGGLLGTLFGTGGPFYVIYFAMRGLEKNEFRASYAVYFLLDGLVRVTVYIFGLRLLRIEWLGLFALALLPFALGMYSGGKVHKGIRPVVFKRLISVILLVSGTALILQN